MIDRASRDRLAGLLRELAEGSVTKVEFHEQLPRSKDLAVREIIEQAWLLCRDLPEPKTGTRKKLPRDSRGEVARWILFLESDREYEWPALSPLARALGFIPSVITFGLFWAPWRWWFKRRGDSRVWPFIDADEYQAAQGSGRRKRGFSRDRRQEIGDQESETRDQIRDGFT
ncbi:MAG: hypothetical protein QOC81_3996 [Thermoanaerobaculia bacterium]|nr:hypothetical protein [Thermoanaerobaculia bacterium]